MTFGDFKTQLSAIVDERPLSSDSLVKLIPLINNGLNVVMMVAPKKKKHKIVQADLMSRYTLKDPLQNFSIRYYFESADEKNTHEADKAKAYYFAVDNVATVYVEIKNGDAWEIAEEINHVPQSGFTAYKGLIPTNGVARLRFSGDTYYNYRNIAMWDINFPNVESIPNFQEYSDHEMPDDFYAPSGIYIIGNLGEHRPFNDYKWEAKNILRLNYYSVGEFIVEYDAYPEKLLAGSPDATEIDIAPEAEEALLNFVASRLDPEEDTERIFTARFNSAMGGLSAGAVNMATVKEGFEF